MRRIHAATGAGGANASVSAMDVPGIGVARTSVNARNA
jgi:hypothetical protein